MHPELLVGGVAAVVGAVVVLLWRVQETRQPVTERKIIIPPLGMSTGLAMFLVPQLRIPMSWALCALALGALVLAHPLIVTSRLTRNGDVVMLQRSRAFLWILLGLVVVRLAARAYIGQIVDPLQTASIFFLLAFGMIVRWRVTMWYQYRALVVQPILEPAVEAVSGRSPQR
ncbi:MAG TPA: cytochrome c biogenesis protein CcdC [Candidatus Binatia bacterium]|jgi:membrane protein CcdC involved in cytochrome C biogenesis